MGWRNRLRKAQIEAGDLTVTVVNGVPRGKALEVAEKFATPSVSKFEKMNIAGQTKSMSYLMKASGKSGMISALTNGFSDEFRVKAFSGMTEEDMVRPYLDCPE